MKREIWTLLGSTLTCCAHPRSGRRVRAPWAHKSSRMRTIVCETLAVHSDCVVLARQSERYKEARNEPRIGIDMKLTLLALALPLLSGALANTQTNTTELASKAKELSKEKCNTGLGQVAIHCERCAVQVVECLLFPDEGTKCINPKSTAVKACNNCIHKLTDLLD